MGIRAWWFFVGVVSTLVFAHITSHPTPVIHAQQAERESSKYPYSWRAHDWVDVIETSGTCMYMFKWSTEASSLKVIPRTQLPKGSGC
jgi:hypothetical protein